MAVMTLGMNLMVVGVNDERISRMTRKEKCDRCKQEWELPDNVTKQVYCYICGCMFCLECWQIQRKEEYETGRYYPP